MACTQNRVSIPAPISSPTLTSAPIPSQTQTISPTATYLPTLTATATSPPPTATASPTATPTATPITIAFAPGVPESYAAPLRKTISPDDYLFVDQFDTASVRLGLYPLSAVQNPLAERYYAVVVPFATITDDISLAEIKARWRGADMLYVTEPVVDNLSAVLGAPTVSVVTTTKELLDGLKETPGALGLLPFAQLDPRFKVLTVDGVNVLSNQLEPANYPLAVALAAEGNLTPSIDKELRGVIQPVTNRAADRLTMLIMTGVTAMSRGTAEKMEEKGYTYPAQIISATLRAADITHVSNEVPFIGGCEVKNTVNNLILCSDYPYWQTLEAIGTDIVGLSGNHVNDFGRDGARESLKFYRDRDIPIYGSGLNIEEACAPLRWEHHGNTFAFIAALAWWPESARATAKEPGACYFYDNQDLITNMIAELSQEVDIVAVELQYYETYEPFPTAEQVTDFRALRAAGADIVTGVQSHVPQAMEPYSANDAGGASIIVYGLGNLFFDQMWSWETRTELFVRHTIYQGRLISTEILTAVLEDYAQPRWAAPKERAEILNRIFTAAPERP